MKILITGATGFIGTHVLRALRARGHHLVACGRDPARFTDIEYLPADFATDINVADWLPRLRGVEVVINAVGIIGPGRRFDALHHRAPAALFRACAEAGVKRVVQVSALGADAGATTPYHLSKRAADAVLMGLDLEWYVVRPSLVYGPGGGSFALFRALAALPLTPLPAGGTQMIQPIHIEDLTRALVQCVEGKAVARQVIDAVGPEPMRLRAFLDKLDRHPLRVVPIPSGLAMPLATLNELFGTAPLTRDTLRMLQRGNQADVRPFIASFGFSPRPLDPPPATPAETLHARLYFLRPPLRLSIAFTWLSAGLVSAFFYPPAQSYALLQSLGTPDALAPLLLYGAAGLDCGLGLAMLSPRWLRWAGIIQIAVMVVYTLIISVFLPEYWLHPFGPVVKNLPLLVATLMLLIMEK